MSALPTHRGITFLEVVFASAMLAVVAATVSSGFAVIDRLSRTSEQQLAAHEVAHRLILQFLDNPTDMPNDALPLPAEVTGRIEKFWYLREVAKLTPGTDDPTNVSTRGRINTQQLSAEERLETRLSMITIEVYEDADGRRAAAPIASISRLYDPFAGAEDDPAAFIDHLISEFDGRPEMQEMLRQLRAQQTLHESTPTPAPTLDSPDR